MIDGYYYFHKETKNLIWKKFRPKDNSDFVQKIWVVDATNREHAWTILLEALSLGLNITRAKELAIEWKCIQEGFEEMLTLIKKPTTGMQIGAHIFIEEILGLDPYTYWTELKRRKE